MVRFIDEHREEYGVEPICAVLPVAPSTYYHHKARETDPLLRPVRVQRDERLQEEVRRVWKEKQSGGAVRVPGSGLRIASPSTRGGPLPGAARRAELEPGAATGPSREPCGDSRWTERPAGQRRSARSALLSVLVDEAHHQRGRPSSSAIAKNADALRRISFARFSSRFSRSSSFKRTRSSVLRPARLP